MKVVLELDGTESAEDLARAHALIDAQSRSASAPAAPRRARRTKRTSTLPPLTSAERTRIDDVARADAQRVAHEKGLQ